MKKIFLVCVLVLALFVVAFESTPVFDDVDDDSLVPPDPSGEDLDVGDDDIGDDGVVDDDVADDDAVEAVSLDYLLGLGESLHCVYEAEYEGDEVWYETYISGDKHRLDSSFVMNDAYHETSFINDGTHIYFWSTLLGSSGTMYTVQDYEVHVVGEGQEFVDSMQEFHYDCSPWTPSDDVFVPPADIQFTDMSALLAQYS